MTNVGAFAPNILQYYMLKVDPSLDWNFDSGVMEPDPQKQISSINQAHEQFVVAGHHDNGFTYSPWAQPAEEIQCLTCCPMTPTTFLLIASTARMDGQ